MNKKLITILFTTFALLLTSCSHNEPYNKISSNQSVELSTSLVSSSTNEPSISNSQNNTNSTKVEHFKLVKSVTYDNSTAYILDSYEKVTPFIYELKGNRQTNLTKDMEDFITLSIDVDYSNYNLLISPQCYTPCLDDIFNFKSLGYSGGGDVNVTYDFERTGMYTALAYYFDSFIIKKDFNVKKLTGKGNDRVFYETEDIVYYQ
ncbi:MAG: hypothetical protein J6Z11_12515 [Candidatus Riflebacteria bacterium]|nr:hypothetical protein [Candidatus Riflebacteria bacterium]